MIGKSQTGEPSLVDFERDISAVANHFTNGGVDPKARDFDDYANLLRFAAWRALKKCAVKTYVRRAIWNAAKDLSRQARSWRRKHPTVGFGVFGMTPYDPYPQVDARLDLQKVWSQTPEIFDELISVLNAGSFTTAAQDLGYSRTSMYRRHGDNLFWARMVLEKGR